MSGQIIYGLNVELNIARCKTITGTYTKNVLVTMDILEISLTIKLKK